MRRLHLLSVALVALFFVTGPLTASVLTFDINPSPTPNDPIDQNYGDRITAPVMGGFSYGTTGGFTPNVVVSYGPTGPGPFDYVYWWDQDFGDLVNVVAQFAFSPDPNYGILAITLTADPGFLVSLGSFDLAGWPRENKGTINSVQVFDGFGNTLFSAADVFIPGDLASPGHTTFAFDPGLSANTVVILIDSSNLADQQGLNVGIDNITFSQSIDLGVSDVPEPSTTLLLGGALCLLGILRRFRRR